MRPFNVTRGMLTSAGLDASSVGACQGMWVLGNITANASTRVDGAGGLGIGVLSHVLMVGAGISLVQIVRKLKWPD